MKRGPSEMKRGALYLVAGVITFQLLIITGTLIGCFLVMPKNALDQRTLVEGAAKDTRCNGNNIGELMAQITAAAFSLYAAEK